MHERVTNLILSQLKDSLLNLINNRLYVFLSVDISDDILTCFEDSSEDGFFLDDRAVFVTY